MVDWAEHLLERLCVSRKSEHNFCFDDCNAFNLNSFANYQTDANCAIRQVQSSPLYWKLYTITALPFNPPLSVFSSHSHTHRKEFPILFMHAQARAHYCFFYIVKRHKKRKPTLWNGCAFQMNGTRKNDDRNHKFVWKHEWHFRVKIIYGEVCSIVRFVVIAIRRQCTQISFG